jgi:HD-like signal output (HDOD) protein
MPDRSAGERPQPAESMSVRLRALVERVARTVDLPPLPKVATRAMALASDVDAGVHEVAQVVGMDPALAAQVLRISNSVTYLRRQPARTIRDAIVTVGFQALRRVLIAASARSAFRTDVRVAETLWAHAFLTSLAADELAALAHRPRGGPEFLAGLLHDVGRLVLHVADPTGYACVSTDGDDAHERETYGFTHAEIGACVVHEWGVEDEVVDAILTHHDPQSEPARRLGVAHAIARRIQGGDPSEDGSPPFDGEAAAWIPDLAAFEAQVRARFRAERALFG